MHIEPGVVAGAKLTLGYATAVGAFGLAAKMSYDSIRTHGGILPFLVRSVAAVLLVFAFFELLPHRPVGVSEVHLILGSTLFLIFGAGPAAIGLSLGLLAQGLLFSPADLAQYGMNVTTLLAPLYAMSLLARKIIPERAAYKDVTYRQALALSTVYQGGIVAWVAFWALYGQGAGMENLAQVSSFGAAYMAVILIEPVLDLAVLAAVKNHGRAKGGLLIQDRLYQSA